MQVERVFLVNYTVCYTLTRSTFSNFTRKVERLRFVVAVSLYLISENPSETLFRGNPLITQCLSRLTFEVFRVRGETLKPGVGNNETNDRFHLAWKTERWLSSVHSVKIWLRRDG